MVLAWIDQNTERIISQDKLPLRFDLALDSPPQYLSSLRVRQTAKKRRFRNFMPVPPTKINGPRQITQRPFILTQCGHKFSHP